MKDTEGAMRINKFLSAMGYCSRREADRLVEAGKVTVNGEKAELGRSTARPSGQRRMSPPERQC